MYGSRNRDVSWSKQSLVFRLCGGKRLGIVTSTGCYVPLLGLSYGTE